MIETTETPTMAVPGTNFYRNPIRVAVIAFFADFAYLWWWLWHLFQFARREKFPRARSFWWLLVPFYGLFVLYQQLDDLKRALDATSSSEPGSVAPRKRWFVVVPEMTALLLAALIATSANVFLLGGNGIVRTILVLATSGGAAYLNRRQRRESRATINPLLLVLLFSIGAASVIPTINPAFLIAQVFLFGYLDSPVGIPLAYYISIEAVILGVVLFSVVYAIQGAANELLHARYPQERPRGLTKGEIVAALLGLVFNFLYFYWQFYPVQPHPAFATRVAPAGAPYSYEVPAGFHQALFELPGGVGGAYVTGVDSDKTSDVRDGIFVFVSPLSESVEGLSLSDVKKGIDARMGGSDAKAQSFGSGAWVKIAGMDALEYQYIGLKTPNGPADGVVYFLFRGKNELDLNCRWVPRDKAEFVRGCDKVKQTLTFKIPEPQV
ncbi:MAG: hypothetical protein PVSMB9_01620 [Candidatus Dormibacteria bacterium]